MEPSFRPGDYLLVLGWGEPKPGEAVLARHPRTGEAVVKRLVEWRDGGMWLEGDNPAGSTDSRQLGPFPRGALLGRVWLKIGL